MLGDLPDALADNLAACAKQAGALSRLLCKISMCDRRNFSLVFQDGSSLRLMGVANGGCLVGIFADAAFGDLLTMNYRLAHVLLSC